MLIFLQNTISYTNVYMYMSAQFSCSVMSDSLQHYGLQHTRLPCSWNSCALSQWCHPTNSSSAIPFSSWLLSIPTSGSFPISQFFASDGQSIEASASASVLQMNIQDCFPVGLIGLISLQSKGLSRVYIHIYICIGYCILQKY